MTITEHIELAGDSARILDWEAARKRAAEAIDAFRIKGNADSVADELSGGNQQRLLLALLPPKLKLLLMEHPDQGPRPRLGRLCLEPPARSTESTGRPSSSPRQIWMSSSPTPIGSWSSSTAGSLPGSTPGTPTPKRSGL